jgi:putative transposase
MPTGLKRHHDTGFSHFITCSCYRHMPFLGRAEERDQCLRILRETAEKYQARLRGFVIMPEHIHLILGEPEAGSIATVMQVVKQRSSKMIRKIRPDLIPTLTSRAGASATIPVWETRYYDYLIPNPDKFDEKLAYIHLNPVRRNLVDKPGKWAWSSYREWEERSAQPIRYVENDEPSGGTR